VVELVKRVLGDDSHECAFVLDVVGETMLGAGLYSLAVLVGTKLSSLARHRHIPGG
jgi:hypothetical protein